MANSTEKYFFKFSFHEQKNNKQTKNKKNKKNVKKN